MDKMIVYLDADYKCHVTNDGNMLVCETDAFNGKCTTFIEGCRLVPEGHEWVSPDGEVFTGEMVSPWKDDKELWEAQIEYERQLIEQLKAENGIMKGALAELGVTEDD